MSLNIYVVEEMQKFVSICKCEEITTEEKAGRKCLKIFDQNWAVLAASDKGSRFEQEKLLPLDKEDI